MTIIAIVIAFNTTKRDRETPIKRLKRGSKRDKRVAGRAWLVSPLFSGWFSVYTARNAG